MLRALLLIALALAAGAPARADPALEVTVSAAWKGWSRPGRTTEIDVQVGADVAATAIVSVAGGGHKVDSRLSLQPGRTERLQLPVVAGDQLVLEVDAGPGTLQRQEVPLKLSESPLLGLASAGIEDLALEGFHRLDLAAVDLPRQGWAYGSIDALVIDGATLAALDPRQLAALLSYAARCGRIVVLHQDAQVQRLLEGSAGCESRLLMHASNALEAQRLLEASLAVRVPALPDAAAAGSPSHRDVWQAVAVALAIYFAGAVLAASFAMAWWPLPALAGLAAAACFGALRAAPASAPLDIWAEGAAGAPVARFVGRQTLTGSARGRGRLEPPATLAPTLQACAAGSGTEFEFDARRGQLAALRFDARLFGTVTLCFAGGFPMKRQPVLERTADGSPALRNAGTAAWPAGWLVAHDGLRDLPSLPPGQAAAPGMAAASQPPAAVVRLAQARVPLEAWAALWRLDLAGVGPLPAGSQGWLLVPVVAP